MINIKSIALINKKIYFKKDAKYFLILLRFLRVFQIIKYWPDTKVNKFKIAESRYYRYDGFQT